MKKDANSQEIKDKLVANREFTRALNIGGVPMLIVNGNIHPGALFGDELNEVVRITRIAVKQLGTMATMVRMAMPRRTFSSFFASRYVFFLNDKKRVTT